MRLSVILCLFASAHMSVAARWNRRQMSSDECMCPSTAPMTSACVEYTVVTASTTVVSFGGVVTSTASDEPSTTTISSLSTVTVTTATTTLALAGETVFTTNPELTATETRTITYYTSCTPVAYKRKRQEDTTTSLSQPTVTATSTTSLLTLTFVTDIVQSGTVRHATCTCTPKSTTSSLAGTTSSCDCPASTEVTIRLSSRVTATNYVFFTTTSYATVVSVPVVTVTSVDVTTESVVQTQFITQDFVEEADPTTTVTEYMSTTVLNCPTPAQCNNQGIRWAAYNNTNAQGQYNTNSNPNAGNDNVYSSFDPTVFKDRTPVYVGNASTLGGFNYPQVAAEQIRVYNSTVTFTQNYLAIDHVGYLYAEISGTYQFTLEQSDDLTLLWVGPNARSGWTRSNANLVDYYDKKNAVYSFTLFQGNYYPFRIFYANAQGASQFSASVTAPDGTVILNSNSGPSPYLIQYSCHSNAAPPFPDFGNET